MPLVDHNGLPSFARLRGEGQNILPEGRALTQDIRELHIGLLNMMQDKALQATERQFFRLIGDSNQIAQIYVHPFTLPEISRGAKIQEYISQYYEPFSQIQKNGLDGLIITGSNVTDPDLSKAPFWEPLQDVMAWAWESVASTICSCLATHAYMQFHHGQKRTAMKKKLWGVYGHRVLNRAHPVVKGMNTIFDVPHSRFNEISEAQFKKASMKVLVESEKAGVHMATSADGFRMICFQGHPEYDTVSLLKEYKREVARFGKGEISKYPPVPRNYFGSDIKKILKDYKKTVKPGKEQPKFPEQGLDSIIENTWRDSARAVIGNWIGMVYQTTNVNRTRLFMDGVDPDNPLGL